MRPLNRNDATCGTLLCELEQRSTYREVGKHVRSEVLDIPSEVQRRQN